MASQFQVSGVDLDSIFAPYVSGWPQAPLTQLRVGTTDLNLRYAPLICGNPAGLTQIRVGPNDLNTIFAAYGTTGVVVALQPSPISGVAAAGNPSGTVTSNSTTCAGAKGSGSYTYTWHIASGSASFTAPNSQTTAVTGNVAAGTTATGSMYCTISDGTTSVNTNVVAWSLQNTTLATWSFSIFSGELSGGGNTNIGYYQGSIGSITGGTLGPLTITVVMDTNSIASYTSFTISGFSADPGKAYFASLSCNGITLTTATSGYGYGSGVANWSWYGSVFGFVNNTATSGVVHF